MTHERRLARALELLACAPSDAEISHYGDGTDTLSRWHDDVRAAFPELQDCAGEASRARKLERRVASQRRRITRLIAIAKGMRTNLHGRDDFIVREGLWQKFVDKAEDIQPDDTLLQFKFHTSPDGPRELLRLTPDGRVFAFTDDGTAYEIDSQALFDALQKFHRS